MLNNAYVQAARAKNRERSKRYYDTKKKNDPGNIKHSQRNVKKIVNLLSF